MGNRNRPGDVRVWGLIVFALVVAVLGATFMRLHPPNTLTMAAGPKNGGYYQIALKYKKILARDDIELEILETAGSSENVSLLENRTAQVAILQGGIVTDDGSIEAIGSILYEPLIPLVRVDADVPGKPSDWRDLRISSGAPGSGTFTAFEHLLRAVRLAGNANDLFYYGYQEAVDRLVAGDLEMAIFVAPIEAPYLEDAFWHPELQILQMDHIEAISRRLNYADVVDVPAGALAVERVIPRKNMTLLALDARLAVTPDVHPALINRLTMAAIELHSARSLINEENRFPSTIGTEMPVNNAARLLIQEGPSAWHDWLSYWLAAQVNHMLLLVLPILFILVPTLRAIPAIYSYFMRWRVWQHYPLIREIEEGVETAEDTNNLQLMETQLVELDDHFSKLRLPAAYRHGAYDARLHIGLVRKKIGERLQQLQDI